MFLSYRFRILCDVFCVFALFCVRFCFLSTSQAISWEEHRRINLFYVESDVKP